jgi:flagellar basal-body rod protein FlgF
MKNPTYIGLSLQVALQRKMDVIANNMANMNTAGFKAQRVMFQSYMMPKNGTVTATDQMTMVSDYGTYRDTRPGAIQVTNNPLDIALSGEGYISVQGPSGTLYSRGGSMAISNDGTLVDQGGHPLLDESGSPIVVQQDDKEINISQDGVVSARRGEIGKRGVFKFDRQNCLKPIGSGLYQTSEPALADPDTQVKQGALEGANVEPVSEMTQMIDVQRSYETIAKLMQTQGDQEKDMISKLSTINA